MLFNSLHPTNEFALGSGWPGGLQKKFLEDSFTDTDAVLIKNHIPNVTSGGARWTATNADILDNKMSNKNLVFTERGENPTCETDTYWTAVGGPTSEGQSAEQAHAGTYSWKVVASGASQGIKTQSWTANEGDFVEADLWVYTATPLLCKIQFLGAGGVVERELIFTTNTATWDRFRGFHILETSGAGAQVNFVSGEAGTFYFDDIRPRSYPPEDIVQYTTMSDRDVWMSIETYCSQLSVQGFFASFTDDFKSGVICWVDRPDNMFRISKGVDGVHGLPDPNWVPKAVTYSNGDKIQLAKYGTMWQIFLNGLYMGPVTLTPMTISDSEIVNARNFGTILFDNTYDAMDNAVIRPLRLKQLVKPENGNFNSDTEGWMPTGNNTVELDSDELKITHIDNSSGMSFNLSAANDLTEDMIPGELYYFWCSARVNSLAKASAVIGIQQTQSQVVLGPIDELFLVEHAFFFIPSSATANFILGSSFGSGEIMWIDQYQINKVI